MGEPVKFTAADIERLFALLNEELAATDTQGEVFLVGGAVMCLALHARAATRDLDGVFKPTKEVREAAVRVAVKAGVPDTWLNDGVKGLLGKLGAFDRYLEHSHLKVYVAQREYLLAMKSVAMRLGAEFQDQDDVRFLLRSLNITSASEALAIVEKYFDASQVPLKTRLALEEMLPG